MTIELKVPQVGESITEVQIGEWLKSVGQYVHRDETVVIIETEKATVELPAPESGIIAEVIKKAGDMAVVGEVIGQLEPTVSEKDGQSAPETAPPAAEAVLPLPPPSRVMPAAQRALAASGLQAADLQPTGPGGRLLKEDVLRQAEQAPAQPVQIAAAEPAAEPPAPRGTRQEEIVPMSLVRRRIAERLVRAQQSAALLTTFNEIDMSSVLALRQRYKEAFTEANQVKLGFMSFFIKAAIDALKRFPQLNAELREESIVYRDYYDIGIAVGGGKGLVVPVLRNAERLSFAEIEQSIDDFAKRAAANRLNLEELQGGTFTISNGGIYGSLLSTPIVNPPQSGVLGLHAIQKRAVVVEDQVVIRPMMYVALTYDHRLVDGRESVSFLRRIKEVIEEPSRMLLEI